MIHLHNGTFYTPDTMFNEGQGACCECGCPQTIGQKICNRCLKPFIVIRTKYIPAYIIESKSMSKLVMRTFKQTAVTALVQMFQKELAKQNVIGITVCPHETYLKIYIAKGQGGNESQLFKLKTI